MFIKPVSEVGHLSVDPQLAWIGTPKAPADSSYEGLCVVVGGIGDEERTPTVSFADSFVDIPLHSRTQHGARDFFNMWSISYPSLIALRLG